MIKLKRPHPFVCDEDDERDLPACCRGSTNPVECRKCKTKLGIADRCD
jgi:hypothetical protein